MSKADIIDTNRLIIRPYQLNDLEAVYDQLKDPMTTKYYQHQIHSREQAKQYLEEKILYFEKHNPLGRRAIVLKEANQLIGYCGLEPLPFNDEHLIEISYGLNRKFWGSGYATEAARAILTYGFSTIHLKEIVAAINPKNIASLKVAERLGMKYDRDIDWPKQGKVRLYLIKVKEIRCQVLTINN